MASSLFQDAPCHTADSLATDTLTHGDQVIGHLRRAVMTATWAGAQPGVPADRRGHPRSPNHDAAKRRNG